MSCNCPDTNKCPSPTTCLCGIDLNIYNPSGLLVETIHGNILQGEGEIYYEVIGSTAFESVLGPGYVLNIFYNHELERWEMSYFNEGLGLNILLGVLYGVGSEDCPISNCWDLDCNAVGFNVLGSFDTYFSWQGEYSNGKKSYTFTSDWSGSNINYSLSWGLAPPEALAPAGTLCWSLTDTDIDQNVGFLFGENDCPYGVFISNWNGDPTRFSFDDLGVTGFDMKTSATDCGCCDESILVDLTFEDATYTDIVANVVKDEYGNVVGINGFQYYEMEVTLTPYPATFYLYFDGTRWVLANGLDGEATQYAELVTNTECPFGAYTLFRSEVTFLYVRGVECFDCCDYDTPKNRNLLKKKKAIFVDEISAIRNKEIFGFNCGPEWDDLFRKHLIFDVLWCLPYGKICDEEQQCLINNLNENCNC